MQENPEGDELIYHIIIMLSIYYQSPGAMKKDKHRVSMIPILIIILTVIMIAIGFSPWLLYNWIPPNESPFFNHQFRWCGVRDSNFYQSYYNSSVWENKVERMRKFVEENAGNPEYHFAFALMTPDPNEGLKHIHTAESINHFDPVYPYFLGLIYSSSLRRPFLECNIANECDIPIPWSEQNFDSALAAFDRALVLEPNNAAFYLAKSVLFFRDTDQLEELAYRRGFDAHYIQIEFPHSILDSTGRSCIRDAITKGVYHSHSAEAVSSCLRLLEDSGANTFFSKTYVMGTYLMPSIPDSNIKYYVQNIGPYENNAQNEALIDTLVSLALVGIDMQRDPEGTHYQFTTGGELANDIINIIGDVSNLLKREDNEAKPHRI